MPETIPITDITDLQLNQFDCGITELNDFFRRHAKSNHRKGIGNTFVLVIDQEVIGYHTISMSNTIEFLEVKNLEKRWPSYPIPVTLMGRLAVSKFKQGQGWGKWLLFDAFHKSFTAAQYVASYAVVVDAKNEKVKKFYEQYGFTAFPNKSLFLYMPLSQLDSLVKIS